MHTNPLDLFQAAVDALNREDWTTLSRLCEPASLDTFKRDLLDMLAPPPAGTPQFTVTQLMKAVPTMPRAVAEYQISRFRETLDPMRHLRDEVPSVPSRRELEAMDAYQVFAAWLEGRSLKRAIEHNVERKRVPRGAANDAIADGPHRRSLVPLGFVPEGDSHGYVVYRDEQRSRRPVAEPVQRTGDGWLFLADRDFLLLARPSHTSAIDLAMG